MAYAAGLPCKVYKHAHTSCTGSACMDYIDVVAQMREVDRSGPIQRLHVARIDGIQLEVR